MRYLIRPEGSYSLSRSLKRLQDMPRQIVYRVEEGPSYVRALADGERLGLVRVTPEPEGLSVWIEGELDHKQALAWLRRAFALDWDLAAILSHMDRVDPVMARLLRTYPGARPIGPFSLWESLAWAVIGQQVNLSFAFTLKEALVRLGGQSYGGHPAFPSPERVAALRYEQLQAEKYTRRKAEYVIDLARAVAEGRLDLEATAALPLAEATARLTTLRGVGRWTAEILLMDAGHLNAFPAGDIGVRNAVQRFYGLDHQPGEEQVRQIGAAWAPYSAVACYYLWLGLLDRG
ncbi:MAG: DNA-3-methyladenine glycosylase family protein [Bacillota bacterium]